MTTSEELLFDTAKKVEDTRKNIGEAGNVPYFEDYTEKVKVEPVNIKCDKTWYGNSFILGRSILGSEKTFNGSHTIDNGSYYNTEWSNGSIQIAGGSANGSWIGPICFDPWSGSYSHTGSWDDTASCNYRYFGYTANGSVDISFVSVDESSTLASGYGATGSDDLQYLSALKETNMRIKVELGSPTSTCDDMILSWNPNLLGSGQQTNDHRFFEDKITNIIDEEFTGSEYKDSSVTTGSWDTSGSLLLVL